MNKIKDIEIKHQIVNDGDHVVEIAYFYKCESLGIDEWTLCDTFTIMKGM